MENNIKIGFSYGCLSDSLKKQAKKQKIELKDVELLDKLKHAVILLGFHLLSPSEHDKLILKLHKKVISKIKKNKEVSQ